MLAKQVVKLTGTLAFRINLQVLANYNESYHIERRPFLMRLI
jgi:hypothetical protein